MIIIQIQFKIFLIWSLQWKISICRGVSLLWYVLRAIYETLKSERVWHDGYDLAGYNTWEVLDCCEQEYTSLILKWWHGWYKEHDEELTSPTIAVLQSYTNIINMFWLHEIENVKSCPLFVKEKNWKCLIPYSFFKLFFVQLYPLSKFFRGLAQFYFYWFWWYHWALCSKFFLVFNWNLVAHQFLFSVMFQLSKFFFLVNGIGRLSDFFCSCWDFLAIRWFHSLCYSYLFCSENKALNSRSFCSSII